MASEDFLCAAGWGDARVIPLAGDASARRYERLIRGNDSAVLMRAPVDPVEQVRFSRLARWLTDHGFSAPQILAEAPDQGLMLLEDLGDDLLARLIAADPAREGPLYAEVTDFLTALHQHPAPDFVAPLDGPALGSLVQMTLDWYLPIAGGSGCTALPGAIAALYEALNQEAPVLALRDFHAENLLWLPARAGTARLGLLDFQDAVAAHPGYDLISALQDARRDVSAAVAAREIARYASQNGLDQSRFAALCALLGLQRNLRILGVFTRLCLAMGKAQYVDLIPRVWRHIQHNLTHPALAELAALMTEMPAPTPDILHRIQDQCGQHPMR